MQVPPDELVEIKTTKGRQTLAQISKNKHDDLHEKFLTASTLTFHKTCRIKYYRNTSKRIASSDNLDDKQDTPCKRQKANHSRSITNTFDFKKHCMFCGKLASIDKKNPNRKNNIIHLVEYLTYREIVLVRAKARGDDLGATVEHRMLNTEDLVAAEARYHNSCRKSFFRDVEYTKKSDLKKYAFENLSNFLLENTECQYSLSELTDIMVSFVDDDEDNAYTSKHLKTLLKERFGEDIILTEIPGKDCVVTFCKVSQAILYKNWYAEQCADAGDERLRIVNTAANIIRQDICKKIYDMDSYPLPESLHTMEDLVPETLKVLSRTIINQPRHKTDISYVNKKVSAVQQAIISATRPRSFISPLLLCIGIYIHRKYESRSLIDILNTLGMSCSYSEVKLYQSSIMATLSPFPDDFEGFLNWIFDNADFIINTLDGKNTFHTMGGLKSITPKPKRISNVVLRKKRISSAATIANYSNIPIKSYTLPPKTGLNKVKVKLLSTTEQQHVCKFKHMDNIWLVGMTLGIQSRPSWSAFNQVIMEHSGSFEVSGILPIPFINLDPTNLTTIHSALQFALSESDLHGKSYCITTFDQPLFIKACDIVYACDSLTNKVFPRLGGFHFLMSYFGSIGNIMSGSGLEELWKSVYASETTPHMMSGHAYSRALRAHILTIEALTSLIMSFPEMLASIDMKRLETIYQELLDEKITVTDALGDETVLLLTRELENVILATKQKGRTPTLWIQYYESVQIILQYIRAERTGNWDLHVHCVKMMNKYLHAAGHLQMAKSGHLYLQVMEDMSNTIPKEDLKLFKGNGYFTIRRTHKLWSGVWTDMTIEQVLMRAMKTSGGLTRGRGMTNSTISEWIHCTQLCIPLCEALEDFTSKRIDFSEQHVDEVYKAHKGLRGAVPNRNAVDLDKFIGWFNAHSPFGCHKTCLRNFMITHIR